MARLILQLAGMAALCGTLAGCGGMPAAPSAPLACDDGLKTAFRPDADTTVVAVRRIRAGEALVAVDSQQPVTAARDMCMVKLLVGPGVKAEKDRNARSWSEGIGMEIWLPDGWNERIRNYGGGGWVGGGHRFAGQIGSKVPALVNANMGYASGTHDGGQPHYQDPSFLFLSDGRVNTEGMRDMSSRAIHQQALKTEALVRLYYGKAPRYRYYDGHSQGGRQGLKAAQEWPELYDGFLIGQPAIAVPKFSLASLYPQVVMKAELGIDATDKAAAGFAKKVDAATVRAVKACDREGLGFLLDPTGCGYEPLRDAAALCAGVPGLGVTGTGTDSATCMSAKEAQALSRIWEGPVVAGRRLAWSLPRGSSYGGQVTKAGTDMLALVTGDARYAADAATISGLPLVNAAVQPANRWRELSYVGYAALFDAIPANPMLADYMTDRPLDRMRALNRRMIVWNGLAEDVIPPGGMVDYYQRQAAQAGGEAELQKSVRMYMMPGMAHSSQGRAYAAAGDNARVPMPQLPGNANQNPTPERDQLFTALVNWVERGEAPGAIVIASRDGSTAYPVCVYPQKMVWNGTGSPREAASYSCR
jgi:feruloyl esterase